MDHRISVPRNPPAIYQFVGGPNDGRVLRSDATGAELNEFIVHWMRSENGKVGRQFACRSLESALATYGHAGVEDEAAALMPEELDDHGRLQRYLYRISERTESEAAITLICQYEGVESPTDS